MHCLALVDLLACWNITPCAVTGHSSGEIAAAYACGAISFESAMHAGYARGKIAHLLATDCNTHGGMLAAGLSKEDACEYLASLPYESSDSDRVACINSPKSVTISGDSEAIGMLHTLLEDHKVFVRRLPVDVAYHSHHMLRTASKYRDALAGLPSPVDNDVLFISSVEGEQVPGSTLTKDYWVKSLIAPVLFSDALSVLCRRLSSSEGSNSVVALAEIGQHASLNGPIQQILTELSIPVTKYVYASPLVRNKSATRTALRFAGEMVRNGVRVNLDAVNFPNTDTRPECLTDLPPYPWNHSTSYWHESHRSRTYRNREYPPHALLGTLTPDSSIFDLRRGKYVQLSETEMSWLSGHKLDLRIVFPGAGYLCMALDAAIWHEAKTSKGGIRGPVTLSDVELTDPLILSADVDTVEMMCALRPASSSRGRDLAGRHEFAITSRSDDDLVLEHSRGSVSILPPDRATFAARIPYQERLPGRQLESEALTKPTVHRSFVFGTLRGWWSGSIERKRDHPLLSVDEWDATLRTTGFTGTDCCMDPHDIAEEQTDQLLISAAMPEPTGVADNKIHIVLSSAQVASRNDALYELAHGLSQSLPTVFGEVTVLGDATVENRTCLCLAGLDDTLLSTLDTPAFNAFKSTSSSAKEVIWVTHGATDDCPDPQGALAHGLARALRKENPGVKIITQVRAGEDTEFTERSSAWFIPRLVLDEKASQYVQGMFLPGDSTTRVQSVREDDQPHRLSADGSRSLLDLSFIREEFPKPLGDEEVEIEVRATGINFRDSLILLGEMEDRLVGECSGVVRAVGRNFHEKFAPGDQVYTWYVPARSSIVRAKGCLMPSVMSFEQAASLPIVYATAYYCLFTVAQLQRGETIFIHAGAGGVGQAAITLALHTGATVFPTVGSEEKRKLLVEEYGVLPEHIFSTRTGDFRQRIQQMTDGAGVDVVVNSLAGAFLHDSLHVLAPFGRFLEIGKRDVLPGARMDMATLEKNISITFIDLARLAGRHLQRLADVCTRVHELIVAGIIHPPKPLHVVPVSRIDEAFRHFQSRPSGKTVLSFGPSEQVQVKVPNTQSVEILPDATYMVAGGQGGLGRAMCSWMARHGAKNIVFLSPSGPDKASTQHLVEELASQGVQLRALSADISSASPVKSALSVCKAEMPPMRGVIQAALRLKDTLHKALIHQHLDFFVILSSYTGLIGNAGQASYSGASTFQDAFARWRTSQGQPTRSLNLGPIQGAGYLHEHPEAQESLKHAGLEPVSLDQFLSLLGYAVSQPVENTVNSQIGIGWGPTQTGTKKYAPLFHHLHPKDTATAALDDPTQVEPERQSSPEVMLAEALAKRSTPGLATEIVRAVSCCVSRLTGIAVEDVDHWQSISVQGGDSLVVVEFRNWLRKTIDPSFGMAKDLGLISLQEIADLATVYAKEG
ncbi:hypothetical protein BDW62DRAFT_197254 [Aspergillus aurantiobrunneus]